MGSSEFILALLFKEIEPFLGQGNIYLYIVLGIAAGTTKW